MKKTYRIFIIVFLFSVLISCKRETVATTDNYLPIVFVHGYTGSGDSYELMAQLFSTNDYPKEKIFAFDWNTLPPDAPFNTSYLETFIKKVIRKTGISKVNLVGHS